jgi:serine/threonine-protein kinase RsbW
MPADPRTEPPAQTPPTQPVRHEPGVIRSQLPAEPAAIVAARHAIVDFARVYGAHADDIERIALAVSEAVTNVVRHAYPNGVVGPLRYLADVQDGELQIIIADAGAGLSSTEHRQPGLGMGLQLIADLTSDFALTTLDSGFEVWMSFIFGASD